LHSSTRMFLPPHTPQASKVLFEKGTWSQPRHVVLNRGSLGKRQRPQTSTRAPEKGTPDPIRQSTIIIVKYHLPSQPLHVELSPPHTPQASKRTPLFSTPSQPRHAGLGSRSSSSSSLSSRSRSSSSLSSLSSRSSSSQSSRLRTGWPWCSHGLRQANGSSSSSLSRSSSLKRDGRPW